MAEIQLEVRGEVALVTLDAPERRNALTVEMADELVQICEEIDNNVAIGATVIRGAGGHFCAGAHREVLDRSIRDPTDPAAYGEITRIYESFARCGRLQTPTVAAVNGSAVGAGINLMMAADLRIVAHDAHLVSGFGRLGLHPGGGHFSLLARTAGRQAAAAFALFGVSLDGLGAKDAGLAWDSVPPDEVELRALQLAQSASRDPALARTALASFRLEIGPPGVSPEAGSQIERAAQMWSFRRKNDSSDRSGQ